MKLAIIGCGNIGGAITSYFGKNQDANIEIVALFDIDMNKAKGLAESTGLKPAVYGDIKKIIENKNIDLVLEAASPEAVRLYGRDILSSGKSILVMSVGAFTDDLLFREMKDLAKDRGLKIYVPSGAVAGIDGIKSGRIGRIDSVMLTTRKSPENLDANIKKEAVLYDGPAREGIKKYPKNVNVASTISLSGIGLDKTRLRIIADPKIDRNIHELTVKGDFGEFTARVENVPSKDNPKTSYLAILSAIATLRKIADPVQIGT